MARAPSRHRAGALGRVLQEGIRQASMTWPESVDEALCFGWIDGIRKSIDDERYMIRFTPETGREHLERGQHRPGRRAHGRGPDAAGRTRGVRGAARGSLGDLFLRAATQGGVPGRDREAVPREEEGVGIVRSQPKGYRQNTIRWVMTAKKEETRERRLATLIEDSAAGRRVRRSGDEGPAKKERERDGPERGTARGSAEGRSPRRDDPRCLGGRLDDRGRTVRPVVREQGQDRGSSPHLRSRR